MNIKKSFLMIASAVVMSGTVTASPAKHTIIAPQCLLNTAKVPYSPIVTSGKFGMVEVNAADIEQLAGAKHHTEKACGGFMDVTQSWKKQSLRGAANPAKFLRAKLAKEDNQQQSQQTQTTYKIQHQKETEALLKTISPQTMWSNLTTLTDFHNRYANSDTGVQAAEWIKSKVEAMAKETGHDDVTVYFVKTGGYKQPSVVAKVGKGTGPGIVIGGHMDTLRNVWPGQAQQQQDQQQQNGFDTPHMPGADDDGSGSVTVMETARTILASGMKFEKPIYFVWYSAEELGLIGSQYVVTDFQDKNIPVEAALQLDMTGYAYQNEKTIWLMTDYVSKDVTAFLEKLITAYVKQPYKFSRCGYACSDHASWTDAGVPSAFPFESAMGKDDPYIHTTNDKMEHLSLDHMTDFVKLATSFVVETAVPVTK